MSPIARGVVPVALTVALLAACGGGTQTHRGPLDLYQKGRMKYEQGRVDEAIDLLNRSIDEDDGNPQVHFYLGYVLWTQGQWDPASRSFLQALEINPYYTEARIWLGTTWNEMGDPLRALQEFDRALEDRTYPTPELVHVNIALTREKTGDVEAALASLRAAVEANPSFARAHYEMCVLLDEMGRTKEAIDACRVAEAEYSGQAGYHYRLGVALFRAGREDEAAGELRKVIELAPGSNDAVKASEILQLLEGP